MTEQRMARSDVWRLQYRRDRYARHLSHAELTQRFRDLVLNLVTVTPDGIGFFPSQISPDEISNESTIWMEKATHMLEEFALRYGPYPAGIKVEGTAPFVSKIPEFASELARKAARRLETLGADPSDVSIKFGKRKYMEMLHSSGALRIQPATYFAATVHNEAVKDDELTVEASLDLSREDFVALVSNPQEVPADLRHVRADVRLQLESDYWLYCLSSSLVPRLFIDYGADACVVIRDRARFTNMLRNASLEKLSGTTMSYSAVEYIDPLLPRSLTVPVAFSKHLRYAYQNEHRFCWFPPHPINKAMHCDVEIGSLGEFSDLIVL
jgi:hypothetical protein